jgi:hypothetical protein
LERDVRIPLKRAGKDNQRHREEFVSQDVRILHALEIDQDTVDDEEGTHPDSEAQGPEDEEP